VISFRHRGNFNNTDQFLTRAQRIQYRTILEAYGKEGVRALSAATPVDTKLTSESWDYTIKISNRSFSISWTNSNIQNGVPVAILLQYGHATNNGGYVKGIDYINPSLKLIFDRLATDAWREITKL